MSLADAVVDLLEHVMDGPVSQWCTGRKSDREHHASVRGRVSTARTATDALTKLVELVLRDVQ